MRHGHCDLGSLADIIARELDRLAVGGKRVLVAIDGKAAAGKTSLARALILRSPCTVYHADDFFPRPEQRTPERLSEPGGNLDRERLEAELLSPLRAGADEVSFSPFDCREGRLLPPRRSRPGRIVVIEGSYSCHPALRGYYDLRVFLSVSPEEQARRVAERERERDPEGADGRIAEYLRRWIPLEEKYFAECRVADACELSIDVY